MVALPLRIEARPTTDPARFGLLDTIEAKALPPHGGLAGISYESESCGIAHPWRQLPCTALDLGSISVSVDIARTATVTGTGEPAGTDYTIDWGDGNSDGPGALDGQTNTYAADGDYDVVVTAPDYRASTTITVTDGVATGPFTADAVPTKDPDDGIGEVSGVPIQVYHLHTCRLAGSGTEDQRRNRAERALELGSSRALEEGFGSVIAADADFTDVTPGGTAVPAMRGLAILEQHGGEQYGGRRVIHADLATVTALAAQGLVAERDGELRTVLGSLVIAGPGYAAAVPPSAPAANARWMYATGAVNVWEQSLRVTETALEGPPYTNEYSVLAERIYVPTYECFAAGAEILLEV